MVYIFYVSFTDKQLSSYIRNDSNNENWPVVTSYIDLITNYHSLIKAQSDSLHKTTINHYSIYVVNRDQSGMTFRWQIPNGDAQKVINYLF